MPDERDYKAKVLPVGPFDDIIDLVNTEDIRTYLMDRYSGYLAGKIQRIRKNVDGTERYGEFKNRLKKIDGRGEFVLDVG